MIREEISVLGRERRLNEKDTFLCYNHTVWRSIVSRSWFCVKCYYVWMCQLKPVVQ